MKYYLIIVYFSFEILLKAQAIEDIQLDMNTILEKSSLCAICEIEPIDHPLKKEFKDINFYKYIPIKVYWGSLENNNFSKEVFSCRSSKKEGFSMLVIFKKADELRPGSWEKKYIPLELNKPPFFYTMNGKDNISERDLMKLIAHYTPKKLVDHPLDKVSNSKK